MSTTTPAISWKKEDLLEMIARRIEVQEALKASSELIFKGRLACRIWRI